MRAEAIPNSEVRAALADEGLGELPTGPAKDLLLRLVAHEYGEQVTVIVLRRGKDDE